jgi:glycosyltransferase involved in cell wall biosynthesis
MKKNVLIVADTYFPKIDGIMRFLMEIVPRIKNDVNITLLVPDYKKSWDDYDEIRLKLSRFIKLSGYAPMRVCFGNFKKIKKAVKDCDIVFLQGPALISYLALRYGRKYGKQVIQFIHLIMWELYTKNLPRWLRWCTGILKNMTVSGWYNKCHLLLVPYQELAEELTQLGVKTKKAIVQLGVDTAMFHPADKAEAKRDIDIHPDTIVIGYVGRISKEKNVPALLKAFNRLKIPNIKLLVVGAGNKEITTALQKARNVILPGFKKNVVPYLQAMDIFVMPSLTETTSLATLEAMACGVPVVTTRVGFLSTYVKRDYNGLLVPKGNALNLVLQLRKLLGNEKLRERMSHNARGTALGFSWDSTANKIREVLLKE